MVRDGRFRADLYFRINVLGLRIPPLRERQEDILILADRFLSECSSRYGRNCYFSAEAKAVLEQYEWPGNIRELQNLVRRVSVVSENDEITPDVIMDYVNETRRLSGKVLDEDVIGKRFEEKILPARKKYTLEEALALSGGSKVRAAEILGVSRATLYRMLARKDT